ncbi:MULTISPECIES: KTSC domain-containing protein [Citrobacter]|uniref:KTSC domain-containing protein n=1 Tax=Citrobacter TaxID=544 RepID=UPI00155E780D|nr:MULTISPECIES: KTSC domain-containing protein [Citrobacter]HAT7516912.1 KTSC domain-containing protein [Kluyvera ascorbata]MDM2916609.1 KTSC domain-containing protein [Citrobacter sp. Cpo035]MDM3376376.1 KTSC domain-containing protein [Citrobacter sp. Cb010]MDM3459589.1 KTSC domain-containing protein [Citrobacter sp. Cb036]MDV1611705.1 KTSC domain-containing protein [Citrobacter portucalensis]
MIRDPVSSSNLQSVGYDPATNVLEIAFHSGGVYQYSGVPSAIHQGLLYAGSKGQYFAARIKNSFPFRKVG